MTTLAKRSLSLVFFIYFFALAFAQHVHDHGEEGHDHTAEAAAEEGDAHAGHSHPETAADCVAPDADDYNLGLRIGAIFIIMAASLLGVFGPIILHRISPYASGGFRYWFLTVCKFCVILAVAFIHMIPEASERFESPCVGDGWDGFEGFVGLFALIAVFFIQLIEFCLLTRLHKKQHLDAQEADTMGSGATKGDIEQPQVNHSTVEPSKFLDLSTIILEIGLVVHSIIIGLTLGFADGGEFRVLLIALVFHQFFEGVALGTRINDNKYKSLIKPILLGLGFALTTPVGTAIGIGVNLSSNPYSSSSVLAQAILDSLAAGILLYNAFISLIANEINNNTSFFHTSLIYKVVCFLSMYVGAGLMSLLGKWA
ncbi:Zinc/iron permease [Lichtheimia hyalospora FSU 10163]|nr:Zinc/iron permease [Lichtheimia hyalospora FSU 10163]